MSNYSGQGKVKSGTYKGWEWERIGISIYAHAPQGHNLPCHKTTFASVTELKHFVNTGKRFS